MKKLSDTYRELGIDFTFPIEIKDSNGKKTYYEDISNWWCKWEYDANGKQTCFENSDDCWSKWEYDANGNLTYFGNHNNYWWEREYDSDGNETYYEDNNGYKRGTPRSQSCAGKVIEVDGKKYKLMEL